MIKQQILIKNYHPDFAEETVTMWRTSKERAIGQKEKHRFEDHVYFLNWILPKYYKVELAFIHDKVVGMIAYSKKEISQLYVHVDYQRKGIGETLLQRAKQYSSGRLRLYTFDVNKKAQTFYQKHGFQIVGKGHENEERLLDLILEWNREHK